MILKKFFNQAQHPKGRLGKFMLFGMNHGHAAVSRWGMQYLKDLHPHNMVDLGCGGGENIHSLLTLFPAANASALDYSTLAVETTKKRNHKAIEEGRLSVYQGNVSSLPFEDLSYDLATAFETVYFWPGPLASFREVHRILKPKGLFLIVNEVDGLRPTDQKWTKLVDHMRIFSPEELQDNLKKAGFSTVSIHHQPQKHWICLLAQK